MLTTIVLGVSSAHAQIQFSDVTSAAGVAHQSETYGASWGDLNGDGYPDIYVSNHRTSDSLYLNKGDGTFFDTGNQVRTWVYHERADTHGGAFADFDNDGDQDLLVACGSGNPSQFLVNEHNALIDRTVEFGISIPAVAKRLPVWFDYNDDGLPDFVMTNRAGNAKVYKQNSTATGFVDTTGSTKLVCPGIQYGQLFDFDGDGRLDFICPYEGLFPQAIYNTRPMPWQKLFDSAVPNSEIPLVKTVADSIIGDFNNDRRMDIFLLGGVQQRPSSVVQGGANNLEAQFVGGTKGFKFVSNGAATFNMDWNQAEEGSAVSLSKIKIGASGWSPAAIPFTLDPTDPKVKGIRALATSQADLPQMQIGYDPATRTWKLILQTVLDSSSIGVFSVAYLQVSSTAQISKVQATGLWPGDKSARPTLLMNYAGGYLDGTAAAGLATPIQCGSATVGDYDNDMDVDLFLVCRTGASNTADILYENQGDGTFIAVPGAGGAAGPVGLAVAAGTGTGDSVVTADYDVDGFLDLFVTNGLNMRPLYFGGPNKLFHNRGNANHWIELQLVGTDSAKDAIGARIKATANGVTQLRVVNDGYHRWSQEHTPSHFGLADATTVDLRVEWPSGRVETFMDVPADKLYRITEGSSVAPVALGVAPPYPCGSPDIDGSDDVGVFIWKECTTGDWRLRTSAGGGSATYQGTIASTAAYNAVTSFSPGAGDSVTTSNGSKRINFQFATGGNDIDGLNFAPQPKTSTCLDISPSQGIAVFYGPLRKPVPTNLDLDTFAACGSGSGAVTLSVGSVSVAETAGQATFTVSLSSASAKAVSVDYATTNSTATAFDYTETTGTLTFAPGVTSKTISVQILDDTLAEGNETFKLSLSSPVNATLSASAQATATIADNEISPCGTPNYSSAVTKGAVVWRDCTTGQWFVRFAAGGSTTMVTNKGSVTGDTEFTQVQAYSIDSSDTLDFTTNPSIISFKLNVMGSGQDGFDFILPNGASGCFALSNASAKVRVGAAMTLVSVPFRLDTLGDCAP